MNFKYTPMKSFSLLLFICFSFFMKNATVAQSKMEEQPEKIQYEYQFSPRTRVIVAPGIKYLMDLHNPALQGTMLSMVLNAGIQYSLF